MRRLLTLVAVGLLSALTTGYALADDDDEDEDARATTTTAPGDPPVVENNCTLTLPDQPLSARGLSTPWRLGGTCEMADPDQGAFAEANILDPATGKITVYRPLVIDEGKTPAADPAATPPPLPDGAVVGINIGFQGDVLTLRNDTGIEAGKCVNGLGDSPFGQVIFCNQVNGDGTGFMEVARRLVDEGTLKVPAIGTFNGHPCPTVWTYDVVDQDPVDNTTTTYLINGAGVTIQDTAANRLANPAFVAIDNGSDAGVMARQIGPATGCAQFTAPDITGNPEKPPLVSTLHLQNLQAAEAAKAGDAPTQGLLAAGGPFVTVNGRPSLEKLNLHRVNVGQPTAPSLDAGAENDATDEKFCRGLMGPNGLSKLVNDRSALRNSRSPEPDVSTNLFNNLMFRFIDNSFGPGALGCAEKLGLDEDPVTLRIDANGIVTGADISLACPLGAVGFNPAKPDGPAGEAPPAQDDVIENDAIAGRITVVAGLAADAGVDCGGAGADRVAATTTTAPESRTTVELTPATTTTRPPATSPPTTTTRPPAPRTTAPRPAARKVTVPAIAPVGAWARVAGLIGGSP
jgi:hypothetical protein